MIEKNEDSNQSYKDVSAGYNRSYLFYWGGYGRDQPGITNYNKLDESNNDGYLKSEHGSYIGTPNLSANITTLTSGALSEWDGKKICSIFVSIYIKISFYRYFVIWLTESKGTSWSSSFRASPVLPPPPVLFGFSGIVFDWISKIHIFVTKLKSCLET